MILDLICIAFIIVFITDLSGVVPNIKLFISKFLTKGKIVNDEWRCHILDCSLCQTFWIGLIYLICKNSFTPEWILFVCLLAFLTPVINHLLLLIKDLLTMVLNKIGNIL